MDDKAPGPDSLYLLLLNLAANESGIFLLVESVILGFGKRNTAQGTRNPENDWIHKGNSYN